MVNQQVKLQGSVCKCGGVWFNLLIPESEPSFCPFCKIEIEVESTEGYSERDTQIATPEVVEKVNEAIKKATGNSGPLELSSKICEFCKNETLFDKGEVHKAVVCPFCKGNLKATDPNSIAEPELGDEGFEDMFSELSMGDDLMDKEVIIKKRSFLSRKISAVFLGMDVYTMNIKYLDKKTNTINWINMKDVKYIKEISQQAEVDI